MSGFCTLEFNSSLDCAATASSLPAHISCWHFISSLRGLADGCIPNQGLTVHQLAQLLTNYRVCYEHIFANCRDYPHLPPPHLSPTTWHGTFFGGIVQAIQHLLAPDIATAWVDHGQGPVGQGHQLTIGFLHQMGLLPCIFKDWLDAAIQDREYCQPYHVRDPDKSKLDILENTCSGHIMAIKKSATAHFKDDFLEWATWQPVVHTQRGIQF